MTNYRKQSNVQNLHQFSVQLMISISRFKFQIEEIILQILE
jgi:hypothetical protein